MADTYRLETISLQSRQIGPLYPPFIIAEMSGNHNQSLDKALKIVDAVAESGADALKIQTYTADTMTLDLSEAEFSISDNNSLWKGISLYELYKKAHTPWEWHAPIFERAKKKGLIAFSTPFDETAVDFLESLNVPCYKIASFEMTDLPLIQKVAATGKCLIVSTGMASVAEIDGTVKAVSKEGNKSLILLKCTSTYPATPDKSNIRTIPHMKEMTGCQVGLSDHTLGIGVPIASIALGATVIEKHFTLSRADGGVDSAFSLEPHEFKQMVKEVNTAWQALGKIQYKPVGEETASLKFRRSLYVVEDIKEGDAITKDNVRPIRPGFGLSPKYYDIFLGKKAVRKTKKGTAVDWNLIVEDMG